MLFSFTIALKKYDHRGNISKLSQHKISLQSSLVCVFACVCNVCNVFFCYWARVDSKTLAVLQSNTAVQMAAALAQFVCTGCLVQRKGKASLEVHCGDFQKYYNPIRSTDNMICQSKMKKVYFTAESAFSCYLSPYSYSIRQCLQGPSDINDFAPVSVYVQHT